MGTEAVDRVANLELRLAQQLGVRFASQQAGEVAGFIEERLLEQGKEALGFGFLLGSQWREGHSATPCGGFPGNQATTADLWNFPPPYETLTRRNDGARPLVDRFAFRHQNN